MMTDAITRLTAALAERYRIERELGQGGMATVYLAYDIRNDRQVALKVLRPELAAVIGADRFLAEIKTTANLQHPHILPLFDSGQVEGTVFYAMPYVSGESLRDRLKRERQLPISDAVRIATEVASALDYAHRHGVIHRDIKPENILLHDGSALVADFGIALAASRSDGASRMTETGMSLGTPHYMSPEQAMGERDLDARSDIYALGCVTYEMLAGEPPFTGPNAQSIIARVMTEEPRPLSRQRKSVSLAVETAVFTALDKLPADRYATAAEFAAALADTAAARGRRSIRQAQPAARYRLLSVAGIAAVSLLAGLFIGGRKDETGSLAATDVVRASLFLGDSTVVRPISNVRLAISPGGERVAFVGAAGLDNALWIREIDQPAARLLPDTRGAFGPFFSPDGQSIGFFTAASGRNALKVVSISGGVAQTLVSDSVAGYGGDWGDDGNIYYTDGHRGLARVSAGGGPVARVSRPDTTSGVQEHDFPHVLPGSRHAVVMLWRGSINSNHIGVVDLRTGAVTDLVPGSYARYVAPGMLAIGTAEGRILAARFNPRTAELRGTAMVVQELVQTEISNGTIQFAVSSDGTLVYQPSSGMQSELVWVDRSGSQTPVDSTLRNVMPDVALSPDGTRIAVTRSESGDNQIWIKQLTNGALSRLSFDVEDTDRPVWSPDGLSVAFQATRGNRHTSWIRRADGSDVLRPAVTGDIKLDEIAFDPRGRHTLLRTEGSAPGTRKLLIVTHGTDAPPRVLVESRFDHFAMTLSPDGNWLAYVSTESGASEIYVRPFPGVDSARFVVSVGGGSEPLWARNGTELFYRGPRGEMFAVPVSTGARFTHAAPRLLFSGNNLGTQDFFRSYDVHPDGNRFLMVTSGGTEATSLNMVLNWRSELDKVGR